MSQNGQGAVLVGEFPMPRGNWFGWHTHVDHQIAWAASGVAVVRVADQRTWVLPSGLALWLPAGVRHTTGASATAVLRSLYVTPDNCPVHWTEPTALAVSGLLRELIGHLGRADLSPAARARAEAVLFDELRPAPVTPIGVPQPVDDRLLRIARELSANPADDRALADWGRLVGASARTLARLFVGDTGMTFGQWRGQLRLQAALGLLAEGFAVNRVAGRVGYATPSAFVAAFRRAVGVPPGAYGYGRRRAASKPSPP
jgi:AraC-like DNA-binding protein/quercetin dioxygenase-like cupin family protein